MELYHYAELVVELADKAIEQGEQFSGVFVYEAMEELAAFFVASVLRQEAKPMECALPDMDEWELDVQRVIDRAVKHGV